MWSWFKRAPTCDEAGHLWKRSTMHNSYSMPGEYWEYCMRPHCQEIRCTDVCCCDALPYSYDAVDGTEVELECPVHPKVAT